MASTSDSSNCRLRSKYVDTLSQMDRDLYFDKLTFTDQSVFPDPFTIDSWSVDPKNWPELSYFDIVQYFVYGTNLYTLKETKAYKSLDGYNYAVNGHVQELKSFTPVVEVPNLASNHVVLFADVLPSQRQGQRVTMYSSYILVDRVSTEIITAHCTCMAGSGKACSHAAAIAFKVEFAVRAGMVKNTPTEELCKWNAMSKKKVQPARLKHMDFSKPSLKNTLRKPAKKKLETRKGEMEPLTLEDIKGTVPQAVLLTSLERKSVQLMSVMDSIEKTRSLTFLHTLSSNMTENIIKLIEAGTKEQANSSLWIEQRKGRITSSTVHKVYHCKQPEKLADILCESKNLKNIPAVNYGIIHEEIAMHKYASVSTPVHDNFSVVKSGLILRSDHPHFGASPDGIVSCNCCGKGCLEIKCPFKFQEKLPKNNIFSNFPVFFHENGSPILKKTHEYFSQTQMHMFMTRTNYCDFFMYAKENYILLRVDRDEAFLGLLTSRCDMLYKSVIAPKLVDKYSI